MRLPMIVIIIGSRAFYEMLYEKTAILHRFYNSLVLDFTISLYIGVVNGRNREQGEELWIYFQS